MITRIFITIALVFAVGMSTVFARDFWEVTGCMNWVAMTEYNQNVENAGSQLNALGYNTQFYKFLGAFFVNSVIGGTIDLPAGKLGIYYKNDTISLKDNKSKATYPGGQNAYVLDIDLSTNYMGLGLRYYLPIQYPQLQVFVGGDAGLLGLIISNYNSFKNYDISGNLIGYYTTELAGLNMGGNVEAGLVYWFSEKNDTDFFVKNIGLVFKPGYRFGSGTLTGTKKAAGTYVAQNGQAVSQPVDYSGFYISGGIVLSFIDERVNKDSKKTESGNPNLVNDISPLPMELNTGSDYKDLIAQGNDMYDIKDYKAALDFYNKALLQKETYEVYKKIGTCYFYLNEKSSTKGAYEKALKLNPNDAKLKEWLKNYKK